MRIDEVSRNNLVAKNKNSVKGLQRYKRRVKSRVASSNKEFNQLNLDKFFKQDILDVKIKVHGETDDYIVRISFGGVLDRLKQDLQNGSELSLSLIIRALVRAFNSNDVYINCSCPDFYYRYSFVSTKNDYNSGEPQNIPANITNPNDSLGSGCKHTMLVLANTSWIIKVASVIRNYIEYMKKHRQELYAKIMYPAIYGKEYEEPVQLELEPSDTLQSSETDIDRSNMEARDRSRFQKGNTQGIRFAPKETNTQLDLDTVDSKEVSDERK